MALITNTLQVDPRPHHQHPTGRSMALLINTLQVDLWPISLTPCGWVYGPYHQHPAGGPMAIIVNTLQVDLWPSIIFPSIYLGSGGAVTTASRPRHMTVDSVDIAESFALR